MGAAFLLGMAEMGLDLESIVRAHLAHNMFPPLPSALAPAVVKAIRLCNGGRHDAKVRLPGGIRLSTYGSRPTTAPPAWRVVESTRTESLLDPDPDET